MSSLFHLLGSWTRIVLSIFSATIIVKLWRDQHIVRRKRAELLRQYDCKLPSARPHKDPFGLDDMYEATQAAKSKTWLERQRAQYVEFGNTFSSRFLTTTVINTIEPENIKTVLQTKFQDYKIDERRKKAFAPLLGKAIIQVDDIEWHHSRTRIRKILTTHQVHDVSVFERHVAALIAVIPKDGSTVDLKDLFFRLSADITTDLFFGESTLSLHDRSARNVDIIHAIHAAQSGCQDRWQLGNLAVLMPQRDFRKHIGFVFAYVDKYVERALEYRRVFLDEIESPADTRSVRHDFLKELAKTTGDRQVLKDEILALFLAGSDTTAAALTDLFFEVSRKPSVWQKLREEVETVVHGTPTAQDLRKTPYVEKCIKEGNPQSFRPRSRTLSLAYSPINSAAVTSGGT
ncbi:MAG: hypothetical protein LQ350_004917 [Teloschistes chrysophthalmus]|nr:MAG: hypothetical protein LQ350_004917 [Niorma chrysophthalma]